MSFAFEASAVTREVLRIISGIHTKEIVTSSFHPHNLNSIVKIMLDCPERPKGHKFSIDRIDRDSVNLSKDICLTSGGADSTIAWFKEGGPTGLYVDLGQPYTRKERGALVSIGIPHVYVDLSEYGFTSKMWKHIIPGRNLLFLTIAAELVSDFGTIHFAVTSGEGYYSLKGDKSREFIENFKEWYKFTTGKTVIVKTMHRKTKGQWLKYFMQQGCDIDIIRYKTVTCFEVDGKGNTQCGRCQACLRKFLSFMYNNIDISQDYAVPPMIGCQDFVTKYMTVLPTALEMKDFSHYSKERCIEDIAAIKKAQQLYSNI